MRRAVVPVGDGVGRLAQGGRFAIGEWYGPFFVLDVHPGFGSVALNRQVLQLPAVGGFRNRQCTMLGKPSALLFVLWGNAQVQEHRDCVIVRPVGGRRMAASVLEVATLTGAGVEERPQTVCRFGGGRR